MKNKLIAFTLILSLSLTLPLVPSVAAVKAGASCKTIGITSVASSKTFTCIKSEKKLVWDKGIKVTQSTVDVLLPTVSLDSTFLSADKCELSPSVQNGPPFDLGFKRSDIWANSTGTLNVAVLYLSYLDSKLNPKAIQEYESVQEKKAEEFYRVASYGKLTVNFVNSKNVYSVPKSTASYNLDSPNMDNKTLFEDAMQAASAEFDFTKFEEILLVMPDGVTAKDLGPAYNFEAKLGNATIKRGVQGTYINPSNKKLVHAGYLTHELGHTLGLTHPYVNEHSPAIWDIMQYDDTIAPDLFTWEKFILRWITPNQVSCLDISSLNTTTAYLEANGTASTNKKMLVIRLSSTQAVIVESRRKSTIDKLSSTQEGAIVYKLDLNKGFAQGAVSLVANNEQLLNNGSQPQWFDTLQQGDSVEVSGMKIKVIRKISTGDYISVEKIA
jgi:M6 family metalloprotease-like protein